MTAVKSYQRYYQELVKALVRLIEEKDPFLKGHADRVASGCRHFYRKIGMNRQETDRIYLAGLLHDIGMVYLPLEIIHKPEPLSDPERELIKTHPVIAGKILSRISIMKGVLPLIRHHHEAYDGSGYPDGLQKDAIPIGAGIVAIIDSFSAMTAERPHRSALKVEDALEELRNDMGKKFSPDLVNDFIEFVKPTAPPPCSQNESAQEPGAPENDSAEPPAGGSPQHGLKDTLNKIISDFKRGKIDLPVLPNVVHEVQKVIKNPIATTEDLARVIEKDSVISLKLMSTANSSMYRGTKKINTVAEAVPRLGLKQTQSIVTAIANKGMYDTRREEYKTLMENLWTHSLATASAGRAIAKQLKLADIERFFLMGLIHDIGKVLLFKALTDAIPASGPVPDEFSIDNITQAMQDVHTSFGGALLERWKFEPLFVSIAIMHEGPAFAKNVKQEILVVNLANMLTRKIGYSLISAADLDVLALESAIKLGVTGEMLEPIEQTVQHFMAESKKAF